MIDADYARLLARYGRWQNGSLYAAADRLSDAERRRERGAFFGSIQGTLSHLAWADQLWLSRFTARPKPTVGIPDSASLYEEWQELRALRQALDDEIERWAISLSDDWLAADLSYVASGGGTRSGPCWRFVTHFFNHQTHHRGQVHCLLTQAGAPPPEDTDLIVMPESGDATAARRLSS
ncbi:DinB family protein [Reyranella sp.]|uniref:DinB family protein n=1 Tax=Reyranella sp. TaxID=1929291 RepID=UPI003BAD1375